MTRPPLFDEIEWRDPIGGAPLEPTIAARTPSGNPITGALRIAGTTMGYPIVDSVARLTPELALKHAVWLMPYGLSPAHADDARAFQTEETVDSFGWQWAWNSEMRSAADLRMRVAERFHCAPQDFSGKRVLDAGAGAGDQSRYLVDQGALVVSVDLSAAIEVVASKLRMHPDWVGVQADVTALPLAPSQFDIVYCEGVIQHTRDSRATVGELLRVTRPGGRVLASHYIRLRPATAAHRIRRRLTTAYYEFVRNRLRGLDRYGLLLATGNLAALSYVPLLGSILRTTGTAIRYELMPDFKTTWTNTFDYYGQHEFQRFIAPEEFWEYFESMPGVSLAVKDVGAVVAVKNEAGADVRH
jgi:SAM-dependent methyltransferase